MFYCSCDPSFTALSHACFGRANSPEHRSLRDEPPPAGARESPLSELPRWESSRVHWRYRRQSRASHSSSNGSCGGRVNTGTCCESPRTGYCFCTAGRCDVSIACINRQRKRVHIVATYCSSHGDVDVDV